MHEHELTYSGTKNTVADLLYDEALVSAARAERDVLQRKADHGVRTASTINRRHGGSALSVPFFTKRTKSRRRGMKQQVFNPYLPSWE